MASDFTHFDSSGNAIMVDVSGKAVTTRTAIAGGMITMNAEAMNAVKGGTVKKGDVLSVARIAGIMAAKRCADLIPLCHPLSLDECVIDFSYIEDTHAIEVFCKVKLNSKTGAEMEALTGVSVTLLTIYDMCKAIDRTMHISNIRLLEKTGGKSGHFAAIKTNTARIPRPFSDSD